MKYKASCHCGKVALEFEGEIKDALACNCSICQRKGSLLTFIPREAMTLLTPDSNAATYTFNEQVIKHRFCPTCGVQPYGEGVGPDGKAMAAINVRCIEGIDLNTVKLNHFDGRSL
jgi:hypothetical protein